MGHSLLSVRLVMMPFFRMLPPFLADASMMLIEMHCVKILFFLGASFLTHSLGYRRVRTISQDPNKGVFFEFYAAS